MQMQADSRPPGRTDQPKGLRLDGPGAIDRPTRGTHVNRIFLLIVASMLGVSASVLFSFHELARIADDNLRERVMIALDVETRHQQQLLEEYSYWDEAYEKSVTAVDDAWLALNTGEYMVGKYGLAFTMSVAGNRQATAVSSAQDRPPPALHRLLDSGLEALLARLREQPTSGAMSAWIGVDDEVYLVTADHFHDEETDVMRADGAFLLFGQRLDDALIAHVADRYKLEGLHQLRGGSAASTEGLALRDPSGTVLAELRWPKPDPGKDTMHTLLLIVALCFAIAMLLITQVLLRDRRHQQAYEDKLYALATHDFLTGISNRRAFMQMATNELHRARREWQPISLALIDLDRFKRVNDAFGHEAGDMVLVDMCTAICTNLRDFDLFARLGGEEFVVLLPKADLTHAMGTAERLRQIVDGRSVRTAAGDTLSYSISIGVAEWNGEDSIDRLIARADDALYEAKNSGRNRVRSAAASTGAPVTGAT